MTTTNQKASVTALRQAMTLARLLHPQIRASQLEMLLIVAARPGITQSELAIEVSLSPAAISRAVDVLGSAGRRDQRSNARLGLLTSEPLPNDGTNDQRIKRMKLTEAGVHLVDVLLKATRA